ncbi:transglycosylase SLT domain-containing protein [Streptomyces sp. Vc74B-19]|uniref:aggregation-promoting factor C-terminal-like domain-containing protein n=1 Tax=unclassified Streptomyces TaxID=2593676 RepID=UPI001BFC22BD|nr:MULTISPECIES: transglycosylase SLT domain-containing protein [unclassified Streptomyces]MBT3161668.1 transglycosylase SLT domain-containing protein [Streptomyces sp. Vc74B-19]MCO4695973.1 lytic transglycosylase domain-containing protein [Streptomyces sp. RO-S4]MDU0301446.1 transglycosylase SLT domain-containing protein [Streptomyces sp. PAL114]
MSAASFLRSVATPKKAIAGAALTAATCGTLIAAAPAQAAPTAAPTAASAQATAKKMIGNSAEFQCFSKIVSHESGWNPKATNASSGAYGLVQALPASKMSSAGSDWKTNPATQIKWGLDYMKDRYGSACDAWSFWQANNWY